MPMELISKAKFRKKRSLGTTHSLSTSVCSQTQNDKEYEGHLWPIRDHWLKWTPDPLLFSSYFCGGHFLPLSGIFLTHDSELCQDCGPPGRAMWKGTTAEQELKGPVHKGQWINSIFGASWHRFSPVISYKIGKMLKKKKKKALFNAYRTSLSWIWTCDKKKSPF